MKYFKVILSIVIILLSCCFLFIFNKKVNQERFIPHFDEDGIKLFDTKTNKIFRLKSDFGGNFYYVELFDLRKNNEKARKYSSEDLINN